jgi:hypothetical protein
MMIMQVTGDTLRNVVNSDGTWVYPYTETAVWPEVDQIWPGPGVPHGAAGLHGQGW